MRWAFLSLVPCASGASCDLTPFTDAPRGTSLLQRSHGEREVFAPSEDSYLAWQLLYYASGDRELLKVQNAGLGVSVLWALGLAVSLVVCCSCSLSVLSPELPQLPEPRPTLRSRTVTQPPSVEDKTEKSEARCYSKQQTCCADLVVPRGQQSLVAVPYLRDSEGVVMLDVVDPIGMPLLKAEVDLSALASRSDQPLLVLRNLRPEARGSLLRSPKRGFVDTSALAVVCKNGAEWDICLPDNTIFASLSKEELPMPRFVLKTGPEETTSLIFEGPLDKLVITDAKQRLLAQTNVGRLQFESQRKFYSMEAKSGSDVGLLLCCLICIDGVGG